MNAVEHRVGLVMSCREASRLTSESMDGELTRRERWSLCFHNFYCGVCRRFAAQVRVLRDAASLASPSVREALSSGLRLSRSRRDRIKGLLAEATRLDPPE